MGRDGRGRSLRTTLPFYGVGWQIHIEDLAASIAGRDRTDPQTRWTELAPAYQSLTVHTGP